MDERESCAKIECILMLKENTTPSFLIIIISYYLLLGTDGMANGQRHGISREPYAKVHFWVYF